MEEDRHNIKENLIEMYITQNLSLKETADYFEVSTKVIRNRLKKFEIIKDEKEKKKAALRARKKTCIKKYGVDNPSKSKMVQAHMKETFIKKYGVKNPFQNEIVKKQIKETNLERYGAEHPMHCEAIKNKVKSTNIKKYGVDNPFKSEVIKTKIKNHYKENYGAEYPFQVEKIKAAAIQTIAQRYGVTNPGQIPGFREKVLSTRMRNDNLQAIGNVPVTKLAEELSISCTTLYKWNKELRPDLNTVRRLDRDSRNGISSLEMITADLLNIKKFNKKVLSNSKVQYQPDFKLTDNLFLNVDGLYWHSELKSNRRYHFNLRKSFEDEGYRILQFRENEILKKRDIVVSMINNLQGKIKIKIGARKTEVKVVKQANAKLFLEKNHIMGNKTAKHLGLYYDNILIVLMSYKVFKDKLKIERFCSKLNYIVQGGLSKLIMNLTRNNKIREIESWVDLRYGTGHSLRSIGFKIEKETLGWKWTDFRNTYNRLQCRANMDKRKISQAEHAAELRWYKIYDAGQRLWVKKL